MAHRWVVGEHHHQVARTEHRGQAVLARSRYGPVPQVRPTFGSGTKQLDSASISTDPMGPTGMTHG